MPGEEEMNSGNHELTVAKEPYPSAGVAETADVAGDALVAETVAQTHVANSTSGGHEMADNVTPKEQVDHIAGYNASEDDVPYVDPERTDTSPDDITRAQNRAKYEHEGASKAAEHRKTSRVAEDYSEAYKELIDRHRAEYEQARAEGGDIEGGMLERMEREGKELRTRFSEQMPRFNEKEYTFRKAEEAAQYDDDRGEFARQLDLLRKRAREADAGAKKRGEYADVLRDHPVSQAYKEANPALYDYDYVEALISLEEDMIPYLEQMARDVKIEFERFKPENMGLRELGGRVERVRAELKSLGYALEGVKQNPTVALVERLDTIDNDTTIGEASVIAHEVHRGLVEAYEEEVNDLKRILEEVKAGRGDQAPEPRTESGQPQAA